MSDIPTGYRLTITSWENDADNYRDCIFEGLREADVKYLIALSRLFTSMNGPTGGFGGSAYHYKLDKPGVDYLFDVAEAMNEVSAEHQDADPELRSIFFIDEDGEWRDAVTEAAARLVDYSVEYDDVYIRVFDSYTVHYYESPVKDVTKLF